MNNFFSHNAFKLFTSLLQKIPLVVKFTTLLFFVVLFQIRAGSTDSPVNSPSSNPEITTVVDVISANEGTNDSQATQQTTRRFSGKVTDVKGEAII
jgi:hypothetical protein